MPANSSLGGPYDGVLPIGNVHPNALGYSVIAAQVIAAAVPEPSSWTLVIAALLGLVFTTHRTTAARRRKRFARAPIGAIPAVQSARTR